MLVKRGWLGQLETGRVYMVEELPHHTSHSSNKTYTCMHDSRLRGHAVLWECRSKEAGTMTPGLTLLVYWTLTAARPMTP